MVLGASNTPTAGRSPPQSLAAHRDVLAATRAGDEE
jgi:hypothetical protein